MPGVRAADMHMIAQVFAQLGLRVELAAARSLYLRKKGHAPANERKISIPNRDFHLARLSLRSGGHRYTHRHASAAQHADPRASL